MVSDEQYRQLISYPEQSWGSRASERWASLCERLRMYSNQASSFSVARERKWELASALQKSIRRADITTACRLVSAIAQMPEEFGYFWRRLCVTCCEDIGPADDDLASFTVACASIFTPKKTGAATEQILSFLVDEMCSLSSRSRIYCSMSIIEAIVAEGNYPTLSGGEIATVAWITARRRLMESPVSSWQQWLSQNDWRAERILRFLGLRLPEAIFCPRHTIPQHQVLEQLPSYAFDVHTRVGQEVLRRLMRVYLQSRWKSVTIAFGLTALVCTPEWKLERLFQRLRIGLNDRCGRGKPALERTRDLHCGMLPNSHSNLPRCQALTLIHENVFPQAVLHICEVHKPTCQFPGCVDACQVLVASTEPSLEMWLVTVVEG